MSFADWNIDKLLEQIALFFVKYVSVPALVALLIKATVKIKKRKATFTGTLGSIIVGLGVAYLVGDAIHSIVTNNGFYNIIIAFVAIVSDKTMEYLIFDVEVKGWFKKVGNLSIAYLRKILGLDATTYESDTDTYENVDEGDTK